MLYCNPYYFYLEREREGLILLYVCPFVCHSQNFLSSLSCFIPEPKALSCRTFYLTFRKSILLLYLPLKHHMSQYIYSKMEGFNLSEVYYTFGHLRCFLLSFVILLYMWSECVCACIGLCCVCLCVCLCVHVGVCV